MHRIDTPNAVNSLFVEKDPALGLAPTEVSDDWLNAVQEELVGAVEASGIVLDKSNNGQLALAISALVTPGTFKKNALVNSAFEVNQRYHLITAPTGNVVTSVYPAGGYYVDRWAHNIPSGAGSMTVLQTKHPLDLSAEELPQNLVAPAFFLNMDCTVGFASGDTPSLRQRIEGVRTFADLNVVVSFYARLNGGSTQVVPSLTQNFGSSGSTPVTLTGSAITLTAAWKRYQSTFTLGALTGKTIGAFTGYPDDYVELSLDFDTAATFDLDISNVQLERGTIATEWEALRYEDELLSCLRFYEKSSNGDSAPELFESPAAIAGCWETLSGNVCYAANTPFRVEKRTEPTIVWYQGGSGSATADRILWGGVVRTVSGTDAATRSTLSTGAPDCTGSPSGVEPFNCNWTADAEL